MFLAKINTECLLSVCGKTEPKSHLLHIEVLPERQAVLCTSKVPFFFFFFYFLQLLSKTCILLCHLLVGFPWNHVDRERQKREATLQI